MDEGHKLTDKKLEKLIRKLDKVYSQAAKETEVKLNDYMRRFKVKDDIKLQQVKSGELDYQEWVNWRIGQIMVGKRWEEMRDTLAEDLTHVDEIATQMVGESMHEVYALNHNFGTFEAEKGSLVDTSYTLYDKHTVENLVKKNPDLLKAPSLDKNKDLRWNKQNFQSAITQSILQGEDIRKTAKRVALGTTKKDRNAAVRNARTATTNAENAGRCDSYERAEKMGIKLKQVWLAALDGRTRDSHRRLDDEKIPVGEKFSNGLRFPGDPQGAAHEVWNCRCTLIAEVEGVDYNLTDISQRNNYKLGDMTYDEWKSERGVKSVNSNNGHCIVEGRDISGTWTRRPEQFAYEIEDVINAQGFDGLPRVVSASEFEKAVQESNIICQRIYNARSEETLRAYQEALYKGDWYVDCSEGGSAFGRGMYCFCERGTAPTVKMADGLMSYQDYDRSIVETFTLDKAAKTITFEELKTVTPEGMEPTVFATLKGYSAVTDCGRRKYTVVLNRTACIFKEGAGIQTGDMIQEYYEKMHGWR